MSHLVLNLKNWGTIRKLLRRISLKTFGTILPQI